MSRPNIHHTMLTVAMTLARRATCMKLKVGCVIADAHSRIIGSGYNGVPNGMTHCITTPCAGANAPRGADLCEAVHAEQNALLHCEVRYARTAYVTHAPCMRCTKLLLNTPIERIVFLENELEEPQAQKLWKSSNRSWLSYREMSDRGMLS